MTLILLVQKITVKIRDLFKNIIIGFSISNFIKYVLPKSFRVTWSYTKVEPIADHYFELF